MTIKYIMYPSIMYPELKVCRVHIHFALAVVLLSRIIYLVYKKKKNLLIVAWKEIAMMHFLWAYSRNMRSFFYQVIHAQAKTELQKWKVILFRRFCERFQSKYIQQYFIHLLSSMKKEHKLYFYIKCLKHFCCSFG